MNDPQADDTDDGMPEAPEPDFASELAAKDTEIAELKDRALRAAAELENTRRRLERDKQDATAYAVTGFARDLLGVADNLARALEAIPAELRSDANVERVITGVEMTGKELHNVLSRHGISRIDSVGEKLDPNRHQAMLEVESDTHEPGVIVQELQAGYVIKDRLLRPALVSVAKAKADAA